MKVIVAIDSLKGSLSSLEAGKAVEDGMSEAKAANITLKVDDQETVVSAGDLGLSWANEEVVQEAAELGKSGNIIKRYKDKKDLENESRKYDIDYSVDRSSIQKVLEMSSTGNRPMHSFLRKMVLLKSFRARMELS